MTYTQEELDNAIMEKMKDKDFFKTAKWVAYTNKYNERLISFSAPWSGCFNIPVVNLTSGDCLAKGSSFLEWNKTQPFFEAFMERICLCLNYCKDMTNDDLKNNYEKANN